jgi:hypothetical protein
MPVGRRAAVTIVPNSQGMARDKRFAERKQLMLRMVSHANRNEAKNDQVLFATSTSAVVL